MPKIAHKKERKKDAYLTEWAERSPLLYQSMEETQAEQQLLPDVLLSGAVEEGGV